MTKKFHIVLILVTLGFFLIPSATYACGTNSIKTEKSCCNSTSKGDKKSCCKNYEQKSNNHEKGCGGKCGHSNCTISSVHFNVAFFEIKFNNTSLYSLEKIQNYFNSEANLSSGFSSLWLIPKIS